MNPITAKFMVIFILSMVFLVLIILAFLIIKVWIRPILIRIFKHKDVLKTMDVIMKSEGDSKKKVDDLIIEGIVDLDLIRVAELEILKSKQNVIKVKSSKLSLFDVLNIKWRNFKYGKKKQVQQDSGTGDKEFTKPTDSGTDSGTNSGTESRTNSGTDPGAKLEVFKADSGDAEQRPVQGESTKANGRKGRYFN